MRPRDLRLQNLKLLIAEFGTIAEVARRGQTSEKYLSQLLHKRAYTGNPRGMGDAVAAKLESGCSKPVGWMDASHDEDTITPEDVALAFINGSPEKQEVIKLMARLPDNEAAMLLPIVRSVLAKYE